MSLEDAIDKRIGEVRLDNLDFSFGELISLYQGGEFVISPDFQRLFRWDETQKSRLIESIVLQLPIPQIFVIENENGVLELIDGLQRISSVIQFVQADLIGKKPLALNECELVPELNGLKFDDLSLVLRHSIKRRSVRVIMIKKQSSSFLRYAMFKRLNTGGTGLSDQEIRNCTSRMVGADGVRFYEFLTELAENPNYANCISTLPEASTKQLGHEELVLRFLCLKNARAEFRGNIRNWLDNYMESVIMGRSAFDYKSEREQFNRCFEMINQIIGENAFVRFRGEDPKGSLAPAHFEAVSLGTWNTIDEIAAKDRGKMRTALVHCVQSDGFRKYVGSGSNSLAKFNGRIQEIEQMLRSVDA